MVLNSVAYGRANRNYGWVLRQRDVADSIRRHLGPGNRANFNTAIGVRMVPRSGPLRNAYRGYSQWRAARQRRGRAIAMRGRANPRRRR